MGESAFARSVGCRSAPMMTGAESPNCAFDDMTIWLQAAEMIEPAEYALGCTHAVMGVLSCVCRSPLMNEVSSSVV